MAEPIVGRMIGLPDSGAAAAQPTHHPARPRRRSRATRRGRGLRRLRQRRAISARATDRHGARQRPAGDAIDRRRRLSPDYIYATRAGAFPDDRNFGVFWIGRERLAAAYNMEGAFNHVTLRLTPGADGTRRHRCARSAARALRRHRRVRPRRAAVEPHPQQEINQWKVIGDADPVDLPGGGGVPAQRRAEPPGRDPARADCRAEGAGLRQRRDRARTTCCRSSSSSFIGIADRHRRRLLVGRRVTALYASFFHFPSYASHAAVGRADRRGRDARRRRSPARWARCARAVGLAAGRGDAPAVARASIAGRCSSGSGLGRLLTPAMRMVIRNMERRPLRALLTTLGIASALAIIISAMFWRDALDYMIDVQFEAAQRGDAESRLSSHSRPRALHEVARMPGVMMSEGSRDVPVRLRRRPSLLSDRPSSGCPPTANCGACSTRTEAGSRPAAEGILLTDRLAERLDVRVGDSVRRRNAGGEPPQAQCSRRRRRPRSDRIVRLHGSATR